MGDKPPYRIYIQSYDGYKAIITTDEGAQLNPTEIFIHMEANNLHTAEVTFHSVALDLKAIVGSVTLVCPVCSINFTHNCNEEQDKESRLQ